MKYKLNRISVAIALVGLVLSLYSTYNLDISSSKFEYCLGNSVNASINSDSSNHKTIDADILNNKTRTCSKTAISDSNWIFPQIVGLIMVLLVPILTIEIKEAKKYIYQFYPDHIWYQSHFYNGTQLCSKCRQRENPRREG